jgi:hypothetical protein
MPTPDRSPPARRQPKDALLLLGLALVLVGHFGPWVPHETSALTVTGFELAEFAKFFPQVQGGTVPMRRELFYLPFVTALLLLALLAGRSAARRVRSPNPFLSQSVVVPLCAAALLLIALLPYSIVDAARQALTTPASFVPDPQYTGQLTLVIVGVVLTLLAPLARRLPRRAWGVLIALLALVGAVSPVYQFARLRPLVVALYDSPRPSGLGWGLIVCVAGFVLLGACGVLVATQEETRFFSA